MRQIVSTTKAPGAIAHYSQGVIFEGKLVYTAGQIPANPETGEIIGSTIEDQTRQTMENLKEVVEAAGSSLGNVIKTTVFIRDMGDFLKMNDVYTTYFKSDPPARSTVAVSGLPKDVLVEIECLALIP